MMEAVGEDFWRGCEARLAGGGGERISACIYEAGFGPSNPTVALAPPGGGPFSRCRFGAHDPADWMSALHVAQFEQACQADCEGVIGGVSLSLGLGGGTIDEYELERAGHDMLSLDEHYRRVRHSLHRAAQRAARAAGVPPVAAADEARR